MKKIYVSFILVFTLMSGQTKAQVFFPGISMKYNYVWHPEQGMSGNIYNWNLNFCYAKKLKKTKIEDIGFMQIDAGYYLLPAKEKNINGWGTSFTAGMNFNSGFGVNLKGETVFADNLRINGIYVGPTFLNMFSIYGGYCRNNFISIGNKTDHFQIGLELNLNLALIIEILNGMVVS